MARLRLDNVPADIWARCLARAEAEGWSMRQLVIRLMEDYADRRVTPSGAPVDKAREPDR